MTDEGIKALRNLVVWEAAKGMAIGAGLFATVRIIIPDLINARDDTLTFLAAGIGAITFLSVIGLLFNTVLGIRRFHRKYHVIQKEQQK